jgi:HPr kinase/phosphorylase
MVRQSVTVEQFFKGHGDTLQMRLVADHGGLPRIIREPTVNRPGLALSGFTRYFAYKRVQVFGNAEMYYLRSLTEKERARCFAGLFAHRIPCIVFSRGLRPEQDFLAAAEKAGVPVFQTPLVTMKFINLATLELEMMFAPHGTEIGSMMDVLGVGVLIRGDSGLGKSEAVLALIERGYSLVSDDVTRLTLVGGHDVIGTSSELTRNHMEIRGIGIINVAAMFGVKSVCKEKKLDLVVTLKPANELPDMEQLGMDQEFVKVLGVNIPHIFIPVQLGRELSRLIEVAAYQTKLRMSGYNAAQELENRLIAQMTVGKPSRA